MKRYILLLVLCFFCSGMLSASNMNDYRGNKNSKVYHQRGCKYFNRLSNFEEFSTSRGAERAGYRACRICRPDLVKTEKPMPNNKIMLATKGERNAP